ncbi:MAG: hypothetical protein HN368_18580, partial [Spirochaetales bacterium]|nr:hypothetical protein [Spirochaetales bacterium]
MKTDRLHPIIILTATLCFFSLASCATSPDAPEGPAIIENSISSEEAPESEQNSVASDEAASAASDEASAVDEQSVAEGEEGQEESADSGQTGTSQTGEAGSDGESENDQEADAAEAAVVTEEEPPPPPPPIQIPAPVHQPLSPVVGESIQIMVDAEQYDSVLYDFGAGNQESNSYSYDSFGVKAVTLSVQSGEQAVSVIYELPVTGAAVLLPQTDAIQHNAAWKPLIPAALSGDGDY